jgi:Mor family transcriptional regulator
LTATLDGGNVNGLLYNPANANGEREAGISFGPGSHTLVAAATHPWNGATNYFSKTTNTFTAQANSTIDVQYDGTKADLESLQQSVESKRRLQFR